VETVRREVRIEAVNRARRNLLVRTERSRQQRDGKRDTVFGVMRVRAVGPARNEASPS
jgi:hypothetical protein